jgi:hypothetical protein
MKKSYRIRFDGFGVGFMSQLSVVSCQLSGNREVTRGKLTRVNLAIAPKAISQLVTGNREQGTAAETDNMN